MRSALTLMFMASVFATGIVNAEATPHGYPNQAARGDQGDRGAAFRYAHHAQAPEPRAYRTAPEPSYAARAHAGRAVQNARPATWGGFRESAPQSPSRQRTDAGSARRDGDENGHEWRHDFDREGHERHEGHDERDWYQGYRAEHFRLYGDRYYARQRYGVGFYEAPYGYSSYPWAYGDRLPLSFYTARYVLDDYYDFDLYDPPYGTAWVRVGGDALLVDMETGQIMEIVHDLFW